MRKTKNIMKLEFFIKFRYKFLHIKCEVTDAASYRQYIRKNIVYLSISYWSSNIYISSFQCFNDDQRTEIKVTEVCRFISIFPCQ